jgi:alpha-methylacyl-CoA racemase
MGPLDGIRVIELAGLGPAPFCAMLLADLGADVIRIDRPPSGASFLGLDRVNCRSRRSLALDLKNPAALELLHELVDTADVLIEGLRPGVAERLGIGPSICLERNNRLVFGRMTGWGQEGPLAPRAGHDINYIALSGALDAIGAAGSGPIPPLNLVGDFGGGALYLAMGVLAAIVERGVSGQGQVVDTAMVDGATSLMAMFYEFKAMGVWEGTRGTKLLDGGAPFYTTYETADGRHLAVGALEPEFYEEFIAGIGLEEEDLPAQYDQSGWPELRQRFSAVIATKTRAQWVEVFANTDACVSPVLAINEVGEHDHMVARQALIDVGGVTQPAPAPRFSRSSTAVPRIAPLPGEHSDEVLAELGRTPEQIAVLRAGGAIL